MIFFRHCPPIERPFLTEAGPLAFDYLNQYWQNILQQISGTIVQSRTITEAQFVQDSFNLLLGLPSQSFQWSDKNKCFEITIGTHYTGISFLALKNACQDLMDCGANYVLLNQFCHYTYSDSSEHPGLLMHAYTRALLHYLQHYIQSVLQIPLATLLQVSDFLLFL